jgi:hypothetical protein
MEALIEAHATQLKLPTVRRRFKALADEATREQQTPVAYLAIIDTGTESWRFRHGLNRTTKTAT